VVRGARLRRDLEAPTTQRLDELTEELVTGDNEANPGAQACAADHGIGEGHEGVHRADALMCRQHLEAERP
jgi:hypothetical protein